MLDLLKRLFSIKSAEKTADQSYDPNWPFPKGANESKTAPAPKAKVAAKKPAAKKPVAKARTTRARTKKQTS